MFEIQNKQSIENNSTKKNNQKICSINENTTPTQNTIKFKKIKIFQVKNISKYEFYEINLQRSEQ